MDGEAAPPGIDTSRAHPARVYDYWLGGKDNFAADRAAAEQAISHPTDDFNPNRGESIKRYNERVAEQATLRDQAGTTQFFAGLDLVEPGVVPVAKWRPDSDYLAAMPSSMWCGVARKP